jgi:hypothetical protein
MLRNTSWLVAALVVLSSPVLYAQEPAATTSPIGTEPPAATTVTTPPPTSPSNAGKSWRDLLTLDGLVDAYYSARLTGSGTTPMAFHSFDLQSDTFSVAYARLGLAVKPEPVGFRLDLGYGTVANTIAAASGIGGFVYQAIPQAYLSFAVPTVIPVTIDVGRFATFAGAEVIDNNKNWNYTRSWLFNWAIPLTHTGVRLTIPFSSAFSFQLMAANGWDIVYDNNRAKTFGASANFTAPTGTVIVLNGITGVEAVGGSWRFLADLVVSQTIGPLGLMLNADYGKEGPNSWYGAAGYARYAVLPSLNLGLRGEVFRDAQNFRLAALNVPVGSGVTVGSLTVTAGVPVAGMAEIRGEFRSDFAGQNIFLTNPTATPAATGFSGSQYQLILGALVWF